MSDKLLSTKMLNIQNLDLIKEEVYEIANNIKREYLRKLKTNDEFRKFGKGSLTTKLWEFYNIFNFNKPALNKLFVEIKNFFIEQYKPTIKYYISAWVNIHKKGENLGWHGHWATEMQTYHGYFALQSEPSTTSYIFPCSEEIYVHHNKNGLVLLNKSEGDKHCVSVWEKDYDRISIAFDIIPKNILDEGDFENIFLYCIPFI